MNEMGDFDGNFHTVHDPHRLSIQRKQFFKIVLVILNHSLTRTY